MLALIISMQISHGFYTQVISDMQLKEVKIQVIRANLALLLRNTFGEKLKFSASVKALLGQFLGFEKHFFSQKASCLAVLLSQKCFLEAMLNWPLIQFC